MFDAEQEAVLVEHTSRIAPEGFRAVADTWRALADDYSANVEAELAFERRYLSIQPVGNVVRIDGQLDPEGGAWLRAALDARDRPEPVGVGGGARTPLQQAADNLVELARDSLTWASRPERRALPAVTLTIDAATFAGVRNQLGGARSEIAGVGAVPAETARHLVCDAIVERAVTSGSNVLDLGRRSRVVSNAQRRAVAFRDRHCVFRGCDRPAQRCDVHHLEPFGEGGRTDLDNLVLICRRHHVLTHEGGWRLTREADGRVTTTAPERGLRYRRRRRPLTRRAARGP